MCADALERWIQECDPMLRRIGIEVWTVFLDSEELNNNVAPFLSRNERERVRRLRNPVHQARYSTVRGVLREILGTRIGAEPASLVFSRNPFGKPFLKSCPDLSFNISHSGPWLILAISDVPELGVDIERVRYHYGFRAGAIARRHFAAAERAELGGLEGMEYAVGFTRLWACKEAYAKAKGLGLRLPLNRFAVIGFHQDAPRLLVSHRWPQDSEQFHFMMLPGPKDHVIAVVFGLDPDQSAILIQHHWSVSSSIDGMVSTVVAEEIIKA